MTTALRPDQQTPQTIPGKKPIWIRWWMIALYIVVGLFVLGVFLISLADDTAEPSAATVPPSAELAQLGVPVGYEMFDGSEHGFTIAHPSQWVSIGFTMTPEEVAEAGEETGAEPDVIESYQEMVREGEGPDLYAQDSFSGNNLSVFSMPLVSAMTLDDFEATQAAFLDRVGATMISVERMEVAGFDSLQVKYEWQTPQAVMEGQNYLVVLPDGALYEITVTLEDPNASDWQTVETIIDSFEVVTR